MEVGAIFLNNLDSFAILLISFNTDNHQKIKVRLIWSCSTLFLKIWRQMPQRFSNEGREKSALGSEKSNRKLLHLE